MPNVRIGSKSTSIGDHLSPGDCEEYGSEVIMGFLVTAHSHAARGGAGSVDARESTNLATLGGDFFESRDEDVSAASTTHCNSSLTQSMSAGSPLDHQKAAMREQEETSLEYERSEDDGSMYNGSDDESGKNFPRLRNVESNNVAKDWENPFVMNSSVAFGADDWDDFIQGTSENIEASFVWDKSHASTEVNFETQRNPFSVSPEQEKDVKNLAMTEEQVKNPDVGAGMSISHSVVPVGYVQPGEPKGNKTEYVPEADQEGENIEKSRNAGSSIHEQSQHDVRDVAISSSQDKFADESEEYLNSCSITNVFEMAVAPMVEKTHLELEEGLDAARSSEAIDGASVDSHEFLSFKNNRFLEGKALESCEVTLDPLFGSNLNQLTHHPGIPLERVTELSEDNITNLSAFTMSKTEATRESNSLAFPGGQNRDEISASKPEAVELNEFIDDVLHEMEEILLDSAESPGARFSQGKRSSLSEWSPRDGGLTASTSGIDEIETFVRQTVKIDDVEVIGARQKKGDVSLSERLVGVKEYTVYIIRVWSGKDQWEVERRYRDFLTLYRRLKAFFAEQGLNLPSEWSSIEKESSKIFGSASPDVVAQRSVLIQDCLRSVLHSRFFFKPPNALLWFLSPQDLVPSSPEPNGLVLQPTFVADGTDAENISALGKTIPLIVENRPYKSMKQMLEAQHYCCAGCRKHFDDGGTLLRDFVQTFGWGKPRLCEYMGQLFCSSCHTNETAVLPARVLHNWDFTQYPVCQLAKSYLESIYDKPMLCVSAVNPFLFAKVPGLFHVMGIRKKIGSMLPFVRCPFRTSINKGLGSRRYLIESHDFFALRDLIDLSKGAFAALPTMLETVSRKILEHITELCLICCDVGVPCGARQACRDPSSLIFPFQEDEIRRCKSCDAVFHKQCFKKLGKCHCQVQGLDEVTGSPKMDGGSFSSGTNSALDLLGRRSGLAFPTALFSTLFSRTKSDTMDPRENDTVILMGSLPSTSI